MTSTESLNIINFLTFHTSNNIVNLSVNDLNILTQMHIKIVLFSSFVLLQVLELTWPSLRMLYYRYQQTNNRNKRWVTMSRVIDTCLKRVPFSRWPPKIKFVLKKKKPCWINPKVHTNLTRSTAYYALWWTESFSAESA